MIKSIIHQSLILAFICIISAVSIAQDLLLPLSEIVARAEADEVDYQALLGERCRIGDYGEKDLTKALVWLQKASDAGSSVAKFGLAVMLLEGKGIAPDSAQAAELLSAAIPGLLISSEQANSLAQLTLADAYHDGHGVPQDYLEAKKWYARAAKKGTPRAQNALAVMYINGEGSKPFPETAALWFRRAALQGYPAGMYNYGLIYETGNGIKPSMERALQWYRKAADAGHDKALARLGMLYLHGKGVDQDYSQAVSWLSKAAEKGHAKASFELGNLYFNGLGVEKDLNAAEKWFKAGSVPLNDYEIEAASREGDTIIPGYPPPAYALNIRQGSCGEMILWTLLQHRGEAVTQLAINQAAGSPGRGTHNPELGKLLDHYGISADDQMNYPVFKYIGAAFNPANWFDDKVDEAKAILQEQIITAVKAGKPVILGVKVYPDKHWMWPQDHFILLVGYNETTGEFIYNSDNSRGRIKVEDLLKKDGYSVINRYRIVPFIVVE